ncbi:hypothetical protein NDU88_004238 [Pleurodeles waltl]|uniref:Uncharacterized protein n=1 Tax=Pleurodeles waltl TaxID=8319 RepID=A0AAV7KZR8_PLEWA|nr:hypothetical protein NDU88_004238 [Pleurodeles waltl]
MVAGHRCQGARPTTGLRHLQPSEQERWATPHPPPQEIGGRPAEKATRVVASGEQKVERREQRGGAAGRNRARSPVFIADPGTCRPGLAHASGQRKREQLPGPPGPPLKCSWGPREEKECTASPPTTKPV